MTRLRPRNQLARGTMRPMGETVLTWLSGASCGSAFVMLLGGYWISAAMAGVVGAACAVGAWAEEHHHARHAKSLQTIPTDDLVREARRRELRVLR